MWLKPLNCSAIVMQIRSTFTHLAEFPMNNPTYLFKRPTQYFGGKA
jgi:hypothetical protein